MCGRRHKSLKFAILFVYCQPKVNPGIEILPEKKNTHVSRSAGGWFFGLFTKLALLMLPLILLLFLTEVALRVAGYGRDFPVMVPVEYRPEYLQPNPELGRRYFPTREVVPHVAVNEVFKKQKPANSLRIFVLGGSSAAGYPYLYNGSFSSILREMLKLKFPETRIEMVNLGMPAVSSYAVRHIGLQLAEFQPDMILIYAGHNEFYGGLGVGSSETLGHSRRLVNLALDLQEYRLYQLMGSLVRGAAGLLSAASDDENSGGTLMQRMAENRSIAWGSREFHLASEVFRENIADLAEFCRAQNIPLLIGDLVSNIHDQQPFQNVISDTTAFNNRQRRALAAAKNGLGAEALLEIEKLIEAEPLAASPYYLKGQWQLAGGDSAGARDSFYRAKDLDGLRFRAAEALNDVIYRLAENYPLQVVSLKHDFEKISTAGIPGSNLFLEHLHPNIRGYQLMAGSFLRKILDSKIISAEVQGGDLNPDEVLASLVTPLDREMAAIRIDYLMSGWPFQESLPVPQEHFPVENPTDIRKIALDCWLEKISWEEAHVAAAQYYRNRGDFAAAMREYRTLTLATPLNASPYRKLAQLLMQQRRLREALAILLESTIYFEDAEILLEVANIYLLGKNLTAAKATLETVLRLLPRDPRGHLAMAQAQALSGQLAEARKHIDFVMSVNPNLPGAARLNELLRSQPLP